MTESHTSSRERLLFLHDADVVPGPVGGLAVLAETFDVEVPRHPGFGTPLDDTAAEWDCVADLAQYHLARLDGTGGARPLHLAGAGFGGWVALEMAVRAQHRFASLVLVSPYGVKLYGPTEREFADILLLDPDETVRLGWAAPDACRDMRMPGFPAGLGDAEYEAAFSERAALARFGWKPFMHDPRLRRWLHLLTLPTLVLSGGQDRLVAPDHSRALADLIPSARYTQIPECGHYPYLEAQDRFVAAVTSFVSERSKTGASQ
ncbi:alpha/beta fold hydrolase [Streptomyces sp. NPDC050560]|uniref:alpha/beta fold hydrolase n=1 Tax=Streptomyces sp. NPDC050560 TaxID=3365630 RepID=UPI00378E7A99